jgi:hypothetical protein
MIDEEAIRYRWENVGSKLDERGRRLFAAAEARTAGLGRACNPLAQYAMMADGEQIHSAMYPGSIYGELFSEQTQVNIRQLRIAAWRGLKAKT